VRTTRRIALTCAQFLAALPCKGERPLGDVDRRLALNHLDRLVKETGIRVRDLPGDRRFLVVHVAVDLPSTSLSITATFVARFDFVSRSRFFAHA
jgi:hypothetical protein